MKTALRLRLDLILVGCLFLLSLWLRLYRVEEITPGMWGDEVVVAETGEKLLAPFQLTPFVDVNYGHPTPLLYLGGISTRLLGRTLTAVRLPSLFFGTLSVVLFYIFLRLFLKREIALAVSLVMAFSYPHIALSRLAYEITASLSLQILSAIFLFLALKTHKARYYLGTGLTLGAGLYTYVGFRTFALVLFFVSLILLRKKINYLLLLTGTVFIIAIPLLGYGLSHQNELMARTKSLSVFGQNLPKGEVIKEIKGATLRLSFLFVSPGDPNPRHNPSGVGAFDIATTTLTFCGLIFLLIYKRNLFFLSLFFCLPPVINDIFSLERIPEFHYYGLGHPNTLRIAGIIPVVYFFTAWGIYALKTFLTRFGKQFYPAVLVLTTGIILIINFNFYFNQKSLNQNFYLYNYEFNGVRMLDIADFIKKGSLKEVYISPSFAADPRVLYFSGKNVSFKIFEPVSEENALFLIGSNELTIFDPRLNKNLAQILINDWQRNPTLFNLKVMTNPFGGVEALVFSKRNH